MKEKGKQSETDGIYLAVYRASSGIPIMKIVLVVLSLTLLSFHFMSGLYARYISSASGSGSSEIAIFHVGESDTMQKTYSITGDSASGKTITVEMKNESEVSVLYTFSFETAGNLPLKIKAAPPAGVTMTPSGGNEWSVEKGPGTFDENYSFLVSIDEEGNRDNYIYSGCISDIQVTVTAEQID